MRYYTVHHPQREPSSILRHSADLIFVRDGFSFWALIFQPFWLLANRLWIAGLLYIAGLVIVFVVAWLSGAAAFLAPVLVIAGIVFAFEANDIKRDFLDVHNIPVAGLASGKALADAERQFLRQLERDAKISDSGAAQKERHSDPGPVNPGDASQDLIGLFPKPGV